MEARVEVEEVGGDSEGDGGALSAVGEGGVTKPVESMDTVEGEEKEASAVEGDVAEGAASSS